MTFVFVVVNPTIAVAHKLLHSYGITTQTLLEKEDEDG